MAKIKKRTLRWNASPSTQVVGYKLYWSEDGGVSYNSNSVKVGNVTEVVLPEDVKALADVDGPVEIGIAAIDEVGNESDLITLKMPFQFKVPQAPTDLRLEPQKTFHAIAAAETDQEKREDLPKATDPIGVKGPEQINRPGQPTPYPWGKTSPTSA